MKHAVVVVVVVAGCHSPNGAQPDAAPAGGAQLDAAIDARPLDGPPLDAPLPPFRSIAHSSSLAISADGTRLYAANADADSIAVIDTTAHSLVSTIELAPPPAVGSAGTYVPAVMPRAIALSPDGTTLFATGERSSSLYAIDLATGAIASTPVCSEPIGVLADRDAVYIACAQDRSVVKVEQMAVVASIAVGGEPWALAWLPDGTLLTTLLLGPGAVQIDPTAAAVVATWPIPDVAPRGDARLAHGQVRGIYDAAARPGTHEIWFAHMLLGTDTAQPALDYENSAFAALSITDGSAYETTLYTDAPNVPGSDGAFTDVVSGPHAIAFTADGALALVVDQNSEDVLVVDAAARVERQLVRPLPGHMPDGIAIAPDGAHAYVDERNTGDIAVLAIGSDGVSVEGSAISRLPSDPMPAEMRLGQHLFYSANSDEYPVTTDHWMACATCHLEGRSDAVTWKFAQGPRDTPSNAGGVLGTGFLFRTADRVTIQDYWRTVDTEQGGNFDPEAQLTLLDALAEYVNDALPLPVPPATDPVLVARGQQIFEDPTVGCATCHGGARFTDSGAGNPTLDLAGPVMLHDVGTCNTGAYPDVAHQDENGDDRAACLFDTPSLQGIAATPPYLHDGTAATLEDVLDRTRGTMGDTTALSSDDETALVEYLRSL